MRKLITISLLSLIACAQTKKERVPSFTLKTLDGEIFNIVDHVGEKVIIINFWATWCPPCRAEIPGFVKLFEKYRDKGLLIVGISLDRGSNAESIVRNFIKEYKVNYPAMMGNEEVVKKFGGITAIPTTFILDKKGEIVRKIIGYRDEIYFENIIKELLTRG